MKDQAGNQLTDRRESFCLGDDLSQDHSHSYQAKEQQQPSGHAQYDLHPILLFFPVSQRGMPIPNIQSLRPYRLHDHPHGQHGKGAVKGIRRPHFGADA